MPGVSQLQMLTQLIERQTHWPPRLASGAGIKYLRPVLPGETLQLQLHRDNTGRLLFQVCGDDGEKSKGSLELTGVGS